MDRSDSIYFVSNFSIKTRLYNNPTITLVVHLHDHFGQDIHIGKASFDHFLSSYLEVYSNVGFLILCLSLYEQQLSFTSYSALILWCIGVHLLMSSFNDYGSRYLSHLVCHGIYIGTVNGFG